ncbi:MAG: bifunctional diguanylate cyclase/phosphodiesterase [Thiovulaceae bacterium]|nr:bifunctional diguanylate cyclase/phosphodiesterase [Sulfurimonadaceae bacterium]
MQNPKFYSYIHKQIVVMIFLSLLPGFAYVLLGIMYDVIWEAVSWYLLILLLSVWGYTLHKRYLLHDMSNRQLASWYKKLKLFMYFIFASWTLVFILFVPYSQNNLHYIAIFTQIGASVVAATLLVSDRKIFTPTLLILMVPLMIYFFLIGQLYSYILTIFSAVLLWVLYYASSSSNKLLSKTFYQASHDMLTGLYNRGYYLDHLQQRINTLKQSKQFSYLLLIDLDHFKTINDSLGHDIGDSLLQEVTKRMQELSSKQAITARLGGDEFIITGNYFGTKEDAQTEAIKFSKKLIKRLKEIYIINKHHLYISASIGVSLLNNESNQAHRFIKEADIAMYEVKANGRDGVILFNDELSNRVASHLEIERLLHFALERKEIELYFQPQFNQKERIIGCEVLIRWFNQELGEISPVNFIPIAEQTGIIVELGSFILEESFKTLKAWDEQGIKLDQFSINISMRQFFHHDFLEEVNRLSHTYLTDRLRDKVIFEMTESLLAADINKVIKIMDEIKKLGIRFSMDDFGTGYSSLSYLHHLPVDEIKIDRSFIQNINQNEDDQSMVITIINMASIFNLKVVAEGVENKEQVSFLQKNKCDVYQGFHFSKPLDKKSFEAFHKNN